MLGLELLYFFKFIILYLTFEKRIERQSVVKLFKK